MYRISNNDYSSKIYVSKHFYLHTKERPCESFQFLKIFPKDEQHVNTPRID